MNGVDFRCRKTGADGEKKQLLYGFNLTCLLLKLLEDSCRSQQNPTVNYKWRCEGSSEEVAPHLPTTFC